MGNNLLSNNPFAVLTFIAAPAILTNATSVLAMSTINRMLRTRDRMHELFRESDDEAKLRGEKFIEQVGRVEKQAMFLLSALRWIYIALGAFAAASLVTLLGALFGQLEHERLIRVGVGAGLVLGFVGVIGIVGGCINLLRATQLSLTNIHEEAEIIHLRRRKNVPEN
ncbi:MAG TPA: DUF2721 domain-containing protein [Verrucomicrobiae bacterium]|nr:DUF2721 domain-containing protein [Verrucomicrobiae bacterium]